MGKDVKKVPKRRFKQFQDAGDWEQRKFEEAFIERREKTERENEDTLLSCAINGMYLNSELFGHFRGTTTIGYLRVKKNDLILSAQNLHLGNANVNLRFEHGIISPAYKVYDLNNCDPEFVQAWVKEENTKNFFLAATTEGASQCRKNIEWETLGKQAIPMPSIEEQRQIGAFFKNLDNLITLHQRKLEKVKELKQAYLSEMFPAEGETIPKRRFKGFTGDWEQRKLGDLYTERNEQGDNSLQILSVSIHTGVSDRELTADGLGKKVLRSEDKSTYKHVYAGDLIFNMMRAWQGAIGVAKNEGMTSPAYISAIPNDEVYSLFMNYLLRRKDAINQINNLSYGVTDFRKRLYWDSFTCVTCLIPCIDEQKRITEVFENLDNLITLHQRKLEKLKNLKKAYLGEMFV